MSDDSTVMAYEVSYFIVMASEARSSTVAIYEGSYSNSTVVASDV